MYPTIEALFQEFLRTTVPTARITPKEYAALMRVFFCALSVSHKVPHATLDAELQAYCDTVKHPDPLDN